MSETVNDPVVSRRLEPGDIVRLAVSRFKTNSIEEGAAITAGADTAAPGREDRMALPA